MFVELTFHVVAEGDVSDFDSEIVDGWMGEVKAGDQHALVVDVAFHVGIVSDANTSTWPALTRYKFVKMPIEVTERVEVIRPTNQVLSSHDPCVAVVAIEQTSFGGKRGEWSVESDTTERQVNGKFLHVSLDIG